MKRYDKEIIDINTIRDIINEAQVCRIGMCENGMPYVVPMNFGYRHPCVYIHSAPEGRKIDILRIHKQVCFEVDLPGELIVDHKACKSGMHYRSVIGFGEAYILDDAREKMEGLAIIMSKYAGSGTAFTFLPDVVDKTVVIRIDIAELTGKQS